MRLRPTLAVLCVIVVFGCTCKTTPVAGEARTGAERGPKAGTEAQPSSAERPDKTVRPPSSAGKFYPAEAAQLDAEVRKYVDHAQKTSTTPVKMVLVPHAGLEFSGQIAADSFKQLSPGFERVVVIAGNHNGDANYSGVAVDHPTHYAVPGLEVRVSPAARELLQRPGFVDVPAAHTMHMVEIELPFLRAVNDRPFELVPLVVGRLSDVEAKQVAAELAKLATPKTVFVFSVDLSHYYPYDRAVALDRPCLDALAASDAARVSTCVTDATQVLFMMNELAAKLELTPRLVSYANSGDTSGDKSRVVGYGALVYEDRFELNAAEGQELVRLARSALQSRVKNGATLTVPSEIAERWPRLTTPRGAFVTLKEDGELRGCIGSLAAEKPLAEDVIDNAINAAVSDSRFPPVKPDELGKIAVSVSVLTSPRPLEGLLPDALVKRLGDTKPGLIIEFQGRRSTFLPEVWEQLPETTAFLGHLCRKQGSPEECWRDPAAHFQTYQSQHFAEQLTGTPPGPP